MDTKLCVEPGLGSEHENPSRTQLQMTLSEQLHKGTKQELCQFQGKSVALLLTRPLTGSWFGSVQHRHPLLWARYSGSSQVGLNAAPSNIQPMKVGYVRAVAVCWQWERGPSRARGPLGPVRAAFRNSLKNGSVSVTGRREGRIKTRRDRKKEVPCVPYILSVEKAKVQVSPS